MLSHARGVGGYEGASAGGVEASQTGLYPYGRYEVNDRLSVWGVAGYGEGALAVEPEEQAALRTGLNLAMGSVGVRGMLLEAPAGGGAELAIESDAMAVRTASEAVSGSGGNLAASEADVTRLRLGLEGSRPFVFESGASLTPVVEIGVRHDGGDAETRIRGGHRSGFRVACAGAGSQRGLSRAGTADHEDGDFRERGFSGSLSWDPSPGSARGPSLSVTRSMGAQATGGMEALLGPQTAQALEAANRGGASLGRSLLDAKFGYGFALFENRWTVTPELGLGAAGPDRERYSAGGFRKRRPPVSLSSWCSRRRGGRSPAGAPGAGSASASAGASRTRAGKAFEVRFEGSLLDRPAGGAEHRVGLTLNARW